MTSHAAENGSVLRSLLHGEGSLQENDFTSNLYRGTSSVVPDEFVDVCQGTDRNIVENLSSNSVNGVSFCDKVESASNMPLSDVSLLHTGSEFGPIHSAHKHIPLWHRLLFSELISGHAPSATRPRHQGRPATEYCHQSLIDRPPMFPLADSGFRSPTSTSHPKSISLTSHLARTAPVSTRVSPPSQVTPEPKAFPTIEPTFRDVGSMRSPLSPSAAHVSDLRPSHPVLFYQHHNPFPSSIYTQSSTDCVRHVRSDGLSQGSSTKLVSDSGSVEAAPDESSLTVATLPPLQPASRFRKARIHETVEQWSCGRTSVHDCRLKAIPDWVSDLQKKALVMGQNVAAAIEQKLNCFSCTDLYAVDQDLKNRKPKFVPSVSKFADNHEEAEYRQSLFHGGQTTRSVEGSRAPEGLNLFSFWDGGCRVSCQVARPIVAAGPQKDSRCHETICFTCADSISAAGSNILKRDPSCIKPIDSRNCTFHQPFQEWGSPMHMDKVAVASRDGEGTTLSHSSPLPTVLPSSASMDPATAYLRRHHLECQHSPSHLTVSTTASVRQGDIPTANGLSAALSVVTHLNAEPLDFTSQNVPPLSKRISRAPHHTNPTNIDPLDCIRAILPSSGTAIGMAPPTSPALLDDKGSTFTQTAPSLSLSGKMDISQYSLQNPMSETTDVCTDVSPQLDQMDYTNAVNLQSAKNAVSRRLRSESGSYHNVSQTVCNSRDYSAAPHNHLLTQPLSSPPSPNVSLRYVPVIPQSERAALLHVNKEPLHTGSLSDRASLMWPLVVKVPVHSPRRTVSHATPQRSSKLLSWRTCHGYGATKSSSAGSDRLDARIADSMNVIRGAIENAFQNELAAAHAENIGLLSEIDRLKAEVDSLRGFQAAFYALRPFVPPDIWERLIAERSGGAYSGELATTSVPNSYPDTSSPQVPGLLSGSLQRHT
ncbi:unnamed protein product [Dicrocoelium dendriticum]|nr:unnamed protein product [Dicrocoelium dendriticum]